MSAEPGAATLLRMYEIMTRIKQCDERLRSVLMAGEVAIHYYPPRGQECISAAIGVHLSAEDYVVTTYRGLHDQLAKGVPLRDILAEYLGKATGPCKGKGGPMHVTHPESGLMLTTGVVGSGLPIANGLAWASQLRGDGRVTVVNFGDGASNIGAFHEALNLAGLWKLPVVFVCQNNQYGEHTRLEDHLSGGKVSTRAAGYGMPGLTIDGNDPLAVYHAAGAALDLARRGEGPTLIEAVTYRFYGHAFGDPMEYMPREELQAARSADPVPRFRQMLVDGGHATDDELAAIEKQMDVEFDDAFQFARSSPDPGVEELARDVYAMKLAP